MEIKTMRNSLIAVAVIIVAGVLAYIFIPSSPPAPPVNSSQSSVAPSSPGIQQRKGENLIWPSENFSHANWQRLNNVKVESGVDIAPNGEKTASRLVESTENGRHVVQLSFGRARPRTVHTFSLYAKPAERAGIMFEMRDSQPGKYGTVRFDLRNRSVIKVGDVLDAGVEPAANGWSRYWAAMPYDTERVVLSVSPLETGGGYDYKGDGKSGVIIWGAQFEPASRPGPYAATVTASSTNGP